MYYFDMQKFCERQPDEKVRYDALKFVASLQGLVNREQPKLYINFLEKIDRYWLDKLSSESSFIKKDDIAEIKSIKELMEAFKDCLNGIVLWDENVPATSNVAAMICGVDGLLPVRYDENKESFYVNYIKGHPGCDVKISLYHKFTGIGVVPDTDKNSTGSAKCDAYIWAKEQYLDTGRCNDHLMAYMLDGYSWKENEISYTDLDNTLLANHDYYIAKKAFFFDLSPWGDETPNDDVSQPLGTDLSTMKELLLSQYKRNGGKKFTSVGGFTPWHVKYVGETKPHCKHGGVETEWHYAEILSCYNAMMDADAPMLCGMANASVFCHYPLVANYRQNPEPELELPDLKGLELKRLQLKASNLNEPDGTLYKLEGWELTDLGDKFQPDKDQKDKTYLLYYMGDYDSAAWLSRNIQRVWDDPKRGSIPLAWAFNPNLSERAPHVFDYVYRTKTINDYFFAGDSGAGYINPLYLLEPRKHSGLPGALDLWVEHNLFYYKRFDLSITGFIINGHEPINEAVQKAYSKFSANGAAVQSEHKIKPLVDGTVFHPHSADIAVLDGDMDEAANIIYSKTQPAGTRFHIFRCILCTPGYMTALTDKIKREHPERNYEVLDPYSFFKLLKRSLQV